MSRVRHAIIGAGFGAAVHRPAFAAVPGVEVVALTDSGSGRAARFASDSVAAFSDWRRMLDEVRPDTVSVTVPPNLQREVVAGALHRGIHVLCEKPVGTSPDDAEYMLSQAREADRILAVTYQYRFEPGLSAMREQLRAGRLGAVRRIEFSWITAGRADPSRPWSWQHDAAQGGGVLNAFLPHVLDLIAWLSGCRIVRALGRTAVLIPRRADSGDIVRDVTAEDAVDGLLELDDGSVANIRVTNCQRGGEGMRIEFHAENGVLRFVNRPPFDGPQLVEYCWGDSLTESVPQPVADRPDVDTRVLPLTRLAHLFVAAARGQHRAGLLPSCSDAVEVQRAMIALRTACATGQFQPV